MKNPAAPQNQNALKGEAPRVSKLEMRCERGEKARWVRAANLRRMKLVDWVREKLNAASGQ